MFYKLEKSLVVFVILVCSVLSGQAKPLHGKDSLALKGVDAYYLQFYGGINKSANENMPWSEFTIHPMSFGAFAGLGKELSPLWGWRLALGIDNNKSRNVQECENDEPWDWNDVELFGDVTFDLSDAFRNRNKDREDVPKFNLKAFAGAGGLYTYAFPKDIYLSYTDPFSKKSQLCFGVRAGLTATYRIDSNLKVGVELSHTVATDNFNGVENSDFPWDMRTNLSIGITYMLREVVKTSRAVTTPVVYSRRLRELPDLPLLLPAIEEEKVRFIAGTAYLDFPVNETVIYPDYRKNKDELKRINASVDSALFDESIQILSISLHGYASPESPYSNNTRLATGRTAALVNYLKQSYQFEDGIFATQSTPEDWENLRAFVDVCDRLDPERAPLKAERGKRIDKVDKQVIGNREELLRVIDSDLNPDHKEEVLKKVGGGKPYRWLYENIYPGLRHTDYLIEYKVQKYEVKDAKRLIYTHPEALSVEEMYQVALSVPEGSEAWYDALVIAARQYPENETANYNAAVASIRTRRMKDAQKFLNRAGSSPETEYLRTVMDAVDGRISWVLENGKVVKL